MYANNLRKTYVSICEIGMCEKMMIINQYWLWFRNDKVKIPECLGETFTDVVILALLSCLEFLCTYILLIFLGHPANRGVQVWVHKFEIRRDDDVDKEKHDDNLVRFKLCMSR